MQEIFKIGQIVKPQGIKGELKVMPLTNDITRFKNLKEIIISDKTYRIARTIIAGDTVILSLSGVNDRNTAETFRGKFLCVKREDAVSLKKNEFFVADLVGSSLYLEDELFGKITEITPLKTDIITVEKANGKVVRFPFLSDLLIDFNAIEGRLTLKKDRFNEVCVYED